MFIVRAVLVLMFVKHHIAKLLVFICFSLLGCSLPVAVNFDGQGVSGGVVPPPTNTQRAMSIFEHSPPVGSSVTIPDNGDVIKSPDGTTITDSGDNVQQVSPIRLSPLIP